MPDRFSIRRGNPGSSPVKNDDISSVHLESPVELRPQLTIQIENCADVGKNPCDQLNLEIYHVMGQEDVFRHDGVERIQRGGMARVILSTNERSDIDIHYEGNPPDEGSPTFPQLLEEISEGETHHEFFFGVNPSSLYAFKITATASDCPETTEESEIYYFQTGDTIQLEEVNLVSEPFARVVGTIVERRPVADGFSASFKELIDATVIGGMSPSSSPEVIPASNLHTHAQYVSAFSTSYTITHN